MGLESQHTPEGLNHDLDVDDLLTEENAPQVEIAQAQTAQIDLDGDPGVGGSETGVGASKYDKTKMSQSARGNSIAPKPPRSSGKDSEGFFQTVKKESANIANALEHDSGLDILTGGKE